MDEGFQYISNIPNWSKWELYGGKSQINQTLEGSPHESQLAGNQNSPPGGITHWGPGCVSPLCIHQLEPDVRLIAFRLHGIALVDELMHLLIFRLQRSRAPQDAGEVGLPDGVLKTKWWIVHCHV